MKDPTLRRWLADNGRKDCLLVALRGDAGVVGCVEVANRLGEMTTFTDDDLRLLETLAAHAGIAIANGRLVDRLRDEATHDSLTGLPNRRLFLDRLRWHIATATTSRDRGRFAVFLLDLDRFKEVNDTLGHHSGDQLLREIGERLVAVLPVGATVARLGGDEFGVVLTNERHEPAARRAALALRHALERPVDVDGMTLDAPASIGVALYPDSARDAESLLRHAEVAMYAAKGSSTAVAVYSPELNRYNPRRLALVTQLRRAVDQGELVVHYQPKVALSDRELVGVEALVRWDHPELGLVYPDDFVPLAEHTGAIGPLTAAVLDLALRRCAGWLAEGRRIGVAVNLSARSLLDPELPDQVLALLTAANVPAELLTLEITETSVMSDPDRTLAMLQQLQGMGVRLSVDDFGTGYSSLAYLRRLPVHEVKIDKSFVMPMATDQGDAAVVRAIVDLGHHLALRVVAEGVEDELTRDALRAMGCDVAQGYLYSRPLGEDRLESWMAARTVHVSLPEDARRSRLVRVVG